MHSAYATYGTQFGVVERPTHRNTTIDQAKFEVCAHGFADLSEAGYGVAIACRDKYGYAVEGNTMRYVPVHVCLTELASDGAGCPWCEPPDRLTPMQTKGTTLSTSQSCRMPSTSLTATFTCAHSGITIESIVSLSSSCMMHLVARRRILAVADG